MSTSKSAVVSRKEACKEESGDDVIFTDGHRRSVVSPLVPLIPLTMGDRINNINITNDSTTIPLRPSPPPSSLLPSPTTLTPHHPLNNTPLPHNSLFPILTTMDDDVITTTTLGEPQSTECDDNYYSPYREREVSSMGSTGRSRSGLRLAKKERRQKAKDGNEGAEAFAGDDMGKSCEDEGMTEIVVHTPISCPPPDKLTTDWASPILDPVNPPDCVAPNAASSSQSSTLRRGKRDLMRSWLHTPVFEEVGQLSSDGTITGSSVTSAVLPSPTSSRILKSGLDPLIAVSEPPPSPTYNALPSPSSLQTSISPSGVFSSQICHHFPVFTPMLLDDAVLPTESSSSLSVMHSRPENEGAGSSSMSVMHSRPRDTIRSIQAMRASVSSSLLPPSSQKSLSFAPLDTNDCDQCETERPSSRRRPHPPSVHACSSSSYPNNLSRMAKQQQQDHSQFQTKLEGGFQLEITPSEGFSGNMNSGAIESVFSATASLSLHPGPKPRNVVTFNADAYNLDAWDADVMGLFALPTSDAAVVCSKNESSSSPQLLSCSSSRPQISQETDVCSQTSLSVLSAYFDQSRANGGSPGADLATFSSHQRLHDVGDLSTCVHLFVACDAGSGLQGGDSGRQEWSPSTSALQLSLQNVGGYSAEENEVGFYTTISPTRTAATNISNSGFASHHVMEREYLLGVSGDHVGKNISSILVTEGSDLPENDPPSAGSITIENSVVECSSFFFSDIVSKFVTLDTLVHQATSYTEQLASPISGAAQSRRGSEVRWGTNNTNQQHTNTIE